ncbi:hypothetical protein M514_00602 [Trichuris suis]|uniref:Uncharacterized protein n=1 Tax=Trichuris suis TaxID=68888 RepID=A0A085MSL1_9BILA|nr:hypothetical protein M513_00602 [Trichuris suis]KFD60207.1 hypothetical protein M514_00602 [Trichuris suis]
MKIPPVRTLSPSSSPSGRFEASGSASNCSTRPNWYSMAVERKLKQCTVKEGSFVEACTRKVNISQNAPTKGPKVDNSAPGNFDATVVSKLTAITVTLTHSRLYKYLATIVSRGVGLPSKPLNRFFINGGKVFFSSREKLLTREFKFEKAQASASTTVERNSVDLFADNIRESAGSPVAIMRSIREREFVYNIVCSQSALNSDLRKRSSSVTHTSGSACRQSCMTRMERKLTDAQRRPNGSFQVSEPGSSFNNASEAQ